MTLFAPSLKILLQVALNLWSTAIVTIVKVGGHTVRRRLAQERMRCLLNSGVVRIRLPILAVEQVLSDLVRLIFVVHVGVRWLSKLSDVGLIGLEKLVS